jgi:hypothetical protein
VAQTCCRTGADLASQLPRSRNLHEIQVDAVTGKGVSSKTETPADQAREAGAETAKAR